MKPRSAHVEMQHLRTLLRTAALLSVILTAACSTFFAPGSVYKGTGNLTDLVGEPTLDIGWHFDQFTGFLFDTQWEHYYDPDEHGLFDVPIVATEEMLFAPGILLGYLGAVLYLPLDTEPARPGEPNAWQRLVASDVVFYPWMGICRTLVGCNGCYVFVGIGLVAVYDPLVHDIPVILIGKPLGLIGKAVGKRAPTDAKPRLPSAVERGVDRREMSQ